MNYRIEVACEYDGATYSYPVHGYAYETLALAEKIAAIKDAALQRGDFCVVCLTPKQALCDAHVTAYWTTQAIARFNDIYDDIPF
jgi:hypothetical protein